MYELTVEVPFSAAHRIAGHSGPCANLHGHNYRALITVVGEHLDQSDMLLDFGDLKETCRKVVAPLDHSFLNELPAFADANPTAEAIARHIHSGVCAGLAGLPAQRVRVARVTVYESDTSYATYSE